MKSHKLNVLVNSLCFSLVVVIATPKLGEDKEKETVLDEGKEKITLIQNINQKNINQNIFTDR